VVWMNYQFPQVLLQLSTNLCSVVFLQLPKRKQMQFTRMVSVGVLN